MKRLTKEFDQIQDVMPEIFQNVGYKVIVLTLVPTEDGKAMDIKSLRELKNPHEANALFEMFGSGR